MYATAVQSRVIIRLKLRQAEETSALDTETGGLQQWNHEITQENIDRKIRYSTRLTWYSEYAIEKDEKAYAFIAELSGHNVAYNSCITEVSGICHDW